MNTTLIDKINYTKLIMNDFKYDNYEYRILNPKPTVLEIELKNKNNTKLITIDFENEYTDNSDPNFYPDTPTADLYHYLQYHIGVFNNDPSWI